MDERWRGIHPHRWLFGWVVAWSQPFVHLRVGRMRLTRRGAERLARRLNRAAERRDRYTAESGMDVGIGAPRWEVVGRIRTHPGRVKESE